MLFLEGKDAFHEQDKYIYQIQISDELYDSASDGRDCKIRWTILSIVICIGTERMI